MKMKMNKEKTKSTKRQRNVLLLILEDSASLS